MSAWHLGVDVGGTKVAAVVTDDAGRVAHSYRQPVERGAQGVVRSITEAVDVLLLRAGLNVADAATVGVGIPGTIADGTVRHALNLDVDELDLEAALTAAWGRAVHVENDVNAAAIGAWRTGAPEARSVAYLNLGTGLAAGVILDGALWRGARGVAGEIGHISIDPHGPADGDGLPGGLETYASGSGIVRQWDGEVEGAHTVLAAAAQGDEQAAEIVARLHFGLAHAVRILVLAYDVDAVLVGGGLTGIGHSLLDGAGAIIAGWEAESAFLRSLDLAGRVQMLDGDVPVAAIGAALIGVEHG